jgi:hypothetical protein
VCHRATAGGWIRGVLEQYVAESGTRGRPEGQLYPRSQQAIRDTSKLIFYLTFLEKSNSPRRLSGKHFSNCGFGKAWRYSEKGGKGEKSKKWKVRR